MTVPEVDVPGDARREPQDRHLRARLHLFRPSGRGRGGAQDAGDLRARAASSRRPRARRRSSRRGSRRSATHPLVGEARGLGLVGAVELVADKATKRSFDPKAGVGPRAVRVRRGGRADRPVHSSGDVLSICPPLVITPAEIDELFDRLAGRSTAPWTGQGASGCVERLRLPQTKRRRTCVRRRSQFRV